MRGFIARYMKLEYLLNGIAIVLGVYHLALVSGAFSVSTMEIRLTHLMLALCLVLWGYPAFARAQNNVWDRFISTVLAMAGLAASFWLLSRWQEIAFSGGETERTDYYAGIVIVVLVFEAARRGVGLVLALIALAFFVYPFVSPYLPGLMNSRGYSFERIVLFLTTDTQGIYGIPIGVAANYIIIFTIFGAFLNRFGAGDFFFQLSSRATRNTRAAGAKTAVLFSTFLGMISGSAAGNVAVTGTLTIPMMKREGYAPHQAGAIEAVVSTGGQIMPPVMGAVAGVSAAPWWRVLIEGSRFVVVFVILLVLMLSGYSPFKASFWALILLVIMEIAWTRKLDRAFWFNFFGAIADGARAVAPISAACAAAGIISGVLAISGLGAKIATIIQFLAGGELIVALFLTMVAAIVLGMELPTTAAYLILATVIAPALVKFGLPPLTAHFFVFYYGCISTITPPVALASYVAAGIAGARISEVGWTALVYGMTSYVLPFAFCFGPGLLLQGSIVENGMAIVTGLAGSFALAAAIVGCLKAPLSWPERFVAGASGLLLLFQNPYSALAVAIIFAALWFWPVKVNQHPSRQPTGK